MYLLSYFVSTGSLGYGKLVHVVPFLYALHCSTDIIKLNINTNDKFACFSNAFTVALHII